MMNTVPPSLTLRAAQAGMSMIFALLTLVALSLSAVALIRSVDSGSIVLGNLSFKRDTQLAADDATRTATSWLTSNIAAAELFADWRDNGYYAQSYDALDVTNSGTGANRNLIDWDNNNCSGATTPAACLAPAPKASDLHLPNGVTARYVILRICNGPGDPKTAAIQCARPLTTSDGGRTSSSLFSYGPGEQKFSSPSPQQYFRILVRAKGGRETVTYTDTVVHY